MPKPKPYQTQFPFERPDARRVLGAVAFQNLPPKTRELIESELIRYDACLEHAETMLGRFQSAMIHQHELLDRINELAAMLNELSR